MTASGTTDIGWWYNKTYSAYVPNWVGNDTYIFAIQFSVDAAGNLNPFIGFNSEYFGDSGCGDSRTDYMTGGLYLGTDPQPYLNFNLSGTETFENSCNGTNDTAPVSFDLSWWTFPQDNAGNVWHFVNESYGSPWNELVFTSGPIGASAAQDAARRAADYVSKLPKQFLVK